MPKPGLRIVFAGTPDFAAHHLSALIASPHDIIGVYTQPDRPSGRGKKIISSPVKQIAQEHGVPVYQPVNFKSIESQQELASLDADIMVVVAYGLLLPQVILDTPKLGCINVHASLLPRWRGAAPIQRALQAGDKTTGVTIMQMDIGLDTGDMLEVSECSIESDETGGSLHDKLMALGGPALLVALDKLQNNTANPVSQDDSLACYAHKFTKEEAAIDWIKSAQEIELKVRAFNPFPVAYFNDGKDRVRVWGAQALNSGSNSQAQLPPGSVVKVSKEGLIVATGDSGEERLIISQLQIPGKKSQSIAELLNGYPDRFQVGQRFQ